VVGKPFLADFTLVTLHALVSILMQPKPRQPGERFATLLTLVVLLPAVDYHVVLQLEVADEGLVAAVECAHKLQSIMIQLVISKTRGIAVSITTNITN